MKKRIIIIPATVLTLATPSAITIAKHLDTSSTAPVIKSSAEEWSKTAVVTVTTAATFGGSNLDHYEYCINDTGSIDDCNWKISTVETVRVRNLGTSYVWLRAVSEYGVVSDISDYVLTRVDRNKPTATSENVVTTSSITVTVTATDDSNIKSYEYSINDSEYITDSTSHTFADLAPGTAYAIKVKVTDLAGNAKILSFTESTNSPTPVRVSRVASGSIKLAANTRENRSNNRPTNAQSSKPEKPAEVIKPVDVSQPDESEQVEQSEEETKTNTQNCITNTEPTENSSDFESAEEPTKDPEPTEEPEPTEKTDLPLCTEPDQNIQEDGVEPTQPQEPENSESASTDEGTTVNEPDNNAESDAIENSEPTEELDTILIDEDTRKNTSTIVF